MPRYRKVPSYRSAADLAAYLGGLGWDLPYSEHAEGLAQNLTVSDASRGTITIGNRFTALPMEGWDAGRDGGISTDLARRWLRIAVGGAKLLWFEATAVRADGRANPNQLMLLPGQEAPLAELLIEARRQHADAHGADGLVAGLQLTHSGRWCRPTGEPAPRIAYRHPLLDARSAAHEGHLLSDADLERLIEDYIAAAVRARDAGFDFVDIKHCHGYLLHELLSAFERPGAFGGDLHGRTEFLRRTVRGIRERAPELAIAVRLSAYDFVPFRPGAHGIGEPETDRGYRYAFGGDGTGLGIDHDAIAALLAEIEALGVGLVCLTAGSPYYNPHIQRPAYYPPSDGYLPPEDPLVGVARMLGAIGEAKRRRSDLTIVGSGVSYLQEHSAAVAAGCIDNGWMDSAGLGRMLLSYPELPADVLAGRSLARKRICRTFSDCTTAPRNGLRSGCYPLDEHYRTSADYPVLQRIKHTGPDTQ